MSTMQRDLEGLLFGSRMTFGVLLIFIISPNNCCCCCCWVASVKIPWPKRIRTPYHTPSSLDGAFWFSAQFVLASIWPNLHLAAPQYPSVFPLFLGSCYQLQLTDCLLAWLSVGHLAPAHVIYRGSAAQVSASGIRRETLVATLDWRLATVGPDAKLSLISGQFCSITQSLITVVVNQYRRRFVVYHNGDFYLSFLLGF